MIRPLVAVTTALALALSPIHHETKVQTVTQTVVKTVEAQTIYPIDLLPPAVQTQMMCLAYVESRSTSSRWHLVDTSSAGAEGVWQIMPEEWAYYRAHVKGVPATPNEATLYQQEAAVVWFWIRNHSFHPEWQDPACD